MIDPAELQAAMDRVDEYLEHRDMYETEDRSTIHGYMDAWGSLEAALTEADIYALLNAVRYLRTGKHSDLNEPIVFSERRRLDALVGRRFDEPPAPDLGQRQAGTDEGTNGDSPVA